MRTSLFAITLVTCLGAPLAVACGLDGAINNPFTTAYPGSLSVALSTQHAIGNGQLRPLTALDREPANARLMGWLDQLRERLERGGVSASFALLVVDSGHWTRFEVNGATVRMAAHTGPVVYDSILLSSEAVLAALLEGRLSMGQAEQAGLVRWSGGKPAKLGNTVHTALASGA